jgi:4-hydroxybenzoate polyprenyltransferase
MVPNKSRVYWKDKFHAYMDLGRVHGIPSTALVSIIGAYTVNSILQVSDLIGLVLIAIFAHTAPNAINELFDLKLDAQVPELASKPMVRGIITSREAKWYAGISTIITFILAYIWFQKLIPLIALTLACMWVMWYCSYGKRMVISYEVSFGIAYAFYLLFGALTVGTPTLLTVLASCAIFIGGVFAQWENGLKDVSADRRAGIPSIAVKCNINPRQQLRPTELYSLYGIALKSCLLCICSLTVMLGLVSNLYLHLILGFGIPTQIFLLTAFFTTTNRISRVKLLVLDTLLTAILITGLIIDKIGILGLLLLIALLIFGYVIASYVQHGAEFKFRRYTQYNMEVSNNYEHPTYPSV